ncbi:hypothetical protein D2Q93_02255 [Alicyclobacillaceae bacterium I2511]|nr:hypothetical protein D2Q93_02255 [Alicyclobacillaceae bacterium I2511]
MCKVSGWGDMRMGISGICLGVATTVVPRRRLQARGMIDRPSLYYCRMAHFAAQWGATLILFNPEHVRWSRNIVEAWSPADLRHPYGNWQKARQRLPDIIYENVFVHLAVQGYAHELRQQAAIRGIPLFNPGLPNKWRTSLWLSNSEVSHFIPPAVKMAHGIGSIRRIRKWGTAYLKPVGGYGGMGVTRIETLPKGQYRLATDRARSGNRWRRVVGESQLQTWLDTHDGHFMLQQGLPLLTLNGRKVDFRVVVQRGVEGQWHRVGIVPKIAAVDGVVTNLVAGGERLSLEQCLVLAAREGKSIPIEELTTAALQIAQVISRRYPMTGLLGYDMGITEDGGIWMIETNPKPARSLLTDEMRRQSALYSAGFSVYLARKATVRARA